MSAIMIVVLSSPLWQGVLPPRVVQAERHGACVAQARAPEHLQIRVVRVERRVTWCSQPSRYRGRVWRSADLKVEAVVLQVRKTRSQLRRGRRIRFSYRLSQLCPLMTGPSNRPQPRGLAKGDVVWAFLRLRAGNRYHLGASFFSFTRTLPAIRSLAQWTRHCDRKYPRRRRRRYSR